MELKHFLSDINDLRIHESNDALSDWGKDKLKEYLNATTSHHAYRLSLRLRGGQSY